MQIDIYIKGHEQRPKIVCHWDILPNEGQIIKVRYFSKSEPYETVSHIKINSIKWIIHYGFVTSTRINIFAEEVSQ